MLNYVTRFGVGRSSGAANTATGLDDIVSGDLIFFDPATGDVIDASDITAHMKIGVAHGVGTGLPVVIAQLDTRNIVSITRKALTVNPTVQVTTLSSFTAPVVGNTYRVSVVYHPKLNLISQKQIRLDIDVTATDTSQQTLVDAFVAAINANKTAPYVTATRGGSGGTSTLVLTGKIVATKAPNIYDSLIFDATAILLDESLAAEHTKVATVTLTTKATKAGYLGQYIEDERVSLGHSGVTDFINWDRPALAGKLVAGISTYNAYHIKYNKDANNPLMSDLGKSVNQPNEIVLVAAGATTDGSGTMGEYIKEAVDALEALL